LIVLIRGGLSGGRLCWGGAAPTAHAERWGWTGQKSAEVVVPAGIKWRAGKGRTSSVAEESVLLVPVAVIAAIPHCVGPLRGGDGEVR
jgi:hypothetical protein